MKHRKSDILWKVTLEEIFPDLLRFIYADADHIYDMERGFEFLDKELAELDPHPDEKKDSRFADLLAKAYHRDGQEEWVLLHVEIQDDTDDHRAFAERMYTYFYRIRDRYPGKPISALAIFTGRNGQHMPSQFTYRYRDTLLLYKYPTLSILDYSDEELDKSPNPFAHVITAAKIRLKEGKISEDELLNIKLETNLNFDNLIIQTNNTNVMTFEEYEKMMAKEEAAAAFVENLLKATDYNFTIEKIASLANVTVDFVKEVQQELSVTKQ